MTKSEQNDTSLTFSYSDGANNGYVLKDKKLSYDPIKPIESSSGTYDGGQAKEVSLSTSQMAKLTELINSAVNCKDCQQESRNMMTGMLRFSDKNYILKSNSVEKDELEKEMKTFLQ